jgi:hypothetical protein
MTTHERQELDQIKRDLAVLATRAMATHGAKPDLQSIVQRYGSEEPANYHLVGGNERAAS